LVSDATSPDKVQQRMDSRSGVAAVGDMNAFLKFQAAKV